MLALGAVLALAACSSDVDPSAAAHAAEPSPPVTSVVSPGASPTGTAPVAIRIPGLPGQGVAVERAGGVDLYGFVHGKLLARLRGFRIYDSTSAPGVLVLQRGREYYRLVEYRRRLAPLASRRAADRVVGTDPPGLDLPTPTSHGRPMVGHWRFDATDSRRYDRVIAQWSGECEIPTAFFIELDEDGGDPVPVTGEADPADAPESFALGWTKREKAVVLLPEGACGGSTEPSGVYLFREPGDGRLLVRTGPLAAARMWGTTVAG